MLTESNNLHPKNNRQLQQFDLKKSVLHFMRKTTTFNHRPNFGIKKTHTKRVVFHPKT